MLDAVIAIRERLRSHSPLVHCLTNQVVKNFTANVLLALGAAPAMVEDPGEAGEFASVASGLLVNLGTLSREQIQAMDNAISSARKINTPWVLDPVAVGGLSLRTDFARKIISSSPAIIRGNASEIIALAGQDGGGRGVESGRSSEAALEAARSLSRKTGAVVLVTGKTDYAISGAKEIAIANGHPLLTRVTGVGCAMGAVCAATAAVADSPLEAAVASAVFFGVAGEIAARHAPHPGTFAVKFLDALDALNATLLVEYARVSSAEQ